jgi:hypothetical protein
VGVQPAPDPVLVEPAAIARPLAEQRLVRQLHRSGPDGHQARVGQRLQHRPGAVDPVDLFQWCQPALRGPVPDVREPEQQATGDAPLSLRQPHIRGLGDPRDRPAHAARGAIVPEREHPPGARLPQLEQRRRQQRQRPGLVRDLVGQLVDQRPLYLEAGTCRGIFDRLLELVAIQRPHQRMAPTQEVRETRVSAQPAVEVGAQRAQKQHAAFVVARRRHQSLEELGPLSLGLADGEQLLELVDGDDQAGPVTDAREHVGDVRIPECSSELIAWMLAGSQQDLPPAPAARQGAGPECRQHARPQQR